MGITPVGIVNSIKEREERQERKRFVKLMNIGLEKLEPDFGSFAWVSKKLGLPLEKEEQPESVRPAGQKELENIPCKTCGLETGFPYNGYVWCVATKCADFHTVFTKEEWNQR